VLPPGRLSFLKPHHKEHYAAAGGSCKLAKSTCKF
jgi:hypothetical protein